MVTLALILGASPTTTSHRTGLSFVQSLPSTSGPSVC